MVRTFQLGKEDKMAEKPIVKVIVTTVGGHVLGVAKFSPTGLADQRDIKTPERMQTAMFDFLEYKFERIEYKFERIEED